MAVRLALATTGGFFTGFLYNKHVHQSSQSTEDYVRKPGMPGLLLFKTVSAASAVVLSPPISEPAVPLIQEKQLDLIPAEPPKGYSRVAEIMRFGFPSFSNIRSRK